MAFVISHILTGNESPSLKDFRVKVKILSKLYH